MTNKKKRKKKSFTLPLAPIVGLMAGVGPAIQPLIDGNIEGAVNVLKWNYLGLGHDGRFSLEGIKNGLVPLIVGMLIHKFVGGAPLNLNRTLAAANVPIIRI